MNNTVWYGFHSDVIYSVENVSRSSAIILTEVESDRIILTLSLQELRYAIENNWCYIGSL